MRQKCIDAPKPWLLAWKMLFWVLYLDLHVFIVFELKDVPGYCHGPCSLSIIEPDGIQTTVCNPNRQSELFAVMFANNN